MTSLSSSWLDCLKPFQCRREKVVFPTFHANISRYNTLRTPSAAHEMVAQCSYEGLDFFIIYRFFIILNEKYRFALPRYNQFSKLILALFVSCARTTPVHTFQRRPVLYHRVLEELRESGKRDFF